MFPLFFYKLILSVLRKRKIKWEKLYKKLRKLSRICNWNSVIRSVKTTIWYLIMSLLISTLFLLPKNSYAASKNFQYFQVMYNFLFFRRHSVPSSIPCIKHNPFISYRIPTLSASNYLLEANKVHILAPGLHIYLSIHDPSSHINFVFISDRIRSTV